MNGNAFSPDKYLARLDNPDPWQRELSLEVLWHSKSPVPTDTLTRMLRTDDQVAIRRLTVKMLREMRDPTLKDTLVQALGDEDWQVQGYAILALKELNPTGFQEDPAVKAFLEGPIHEFVRYCARVP